MTPNSIVKDNICNLMELNGLNPSSIAKLVENLGFKITRSYMSKLTDPNKEALNLSLDKLEAIAKAFDIEPADLLNPISIEKDGTIKKAEVSLNIKILEDAILQVKGTAKEVGIDSVEFESRAIPLVYEALLSEDTDRLNLELIKLARKY
ncbi:helix-turn-helix domain-containing protein [Pseudoalteromonas umbrosa]|uniref:helix-turn-helix domain-containing protein n=1 Tax=Pseudoalteromonas umbrosa TaxID=3048489 RepID=UPI0024C25BB3|nr:helix-turn-helix transcriptional regulator [Pseudoalteromonas sp. B95]MDK1289808.1 helix-turn-helix transcriptional regulator [Pseudoalteromonas sp. B95]